MTSPSIEALLQRGAQSDGSNCPGSPGQPCQPDEWEGWVYATDSVTPKAYNVCMHCGALIVVLLPRKRAEWAHEQIERIWVERLTSKDFTVIVDQINSALKESGRSHTIRRGFSENRMAIAGWVLSAIAKSIREELSRDVQRVMEQAKNVTEMLYERIWHYETLTRGVKTKRQRRTAREGNRQLLCSHGQRIHFIYGLAAASHPDRIRYVGRTSHPASRFKAHCESGAPRVMQWMAELREAHDAPEMLLLETCGDEVSVERERHWITEIRRQGGADLNTSLPSTLQVVA